MNIAALPAVNAGLNAASATLLIAGYLCIRRRWIAAHRACMMAAVLTSGLFLCSYVTYHAHVGSKHFPGSGWVRPCYFALLLSHTLLAIVIVPLVARTLYLAVRGRFEAHRALACWTLPLWLYVSVTGIVVYGMLYVVHSP